ncbi:MAG: deoxyribose-phosphate aldolase [Thermodesulfovibrionales bacterium]
MNQTNIARLIDHSLLKPDATEDDIRRLCDEAKQYGFFSVCINPSFITLARGLLMGSGVKVTTVIGFPLGMTLTRVKVYEAIEAVLSGADEIDLVMNIGMARSGQWGYVKKDISDVVSATRGAIHKVIIETCYLDREEKIKASEIVLASGAEFIKTSTGFGPGGASTDDIRLIKTVVKDGCGIKAAGGIKTLSQVMKLIEAGATRIGTSAGVRIVTSNE